MNRWILGWLLFTFALPARADDTRTLPAGVARLRVRPLFSFASQRWSQDGAAEGLTQDLDGRDLNSDVFADLAILERVYGLRAGALSIGTSHVQSRAEIWGLAIAAEVGLSDRLTVGVMLPLLHGRHVLTRLSLDPEASCGAARCGLARNPGDTSITKEDSKYLPLDHDKDPSTRLASPLAEEDVQDILVQDLGYQRLEDWSETGIGDLELGAKWRLYELGAWSTALQVGVRLPTGRGDDPDQLLDLPFGDGQADLGVAWQNDLALWDAATFNATLRYVAQLPDRELRRVPVRVDVPLAKPEDREEISRDLGDSFEAEAELRYAFNPALGASARYVFSARAATDIEGDRGLAYRSLIDETAAVDHSIGAAFHFSTVPWYLEGEAALPIDVSAGVSRSIAGRNNTLIHTTAYLEVAGYFEVLP
jgi:hypothetical protein